MATDTSDDELREAARHRGLRLVKSRKRKPGVGDFGRFGLEDAAGKPVYGVGADGLTASAGDIADYLRKGDNSTWAESARVTPERPQPAEPDRSTQADEGPPLQERPRPRAPAARRRSPRQPERAPGRGSGRATPTAQPAARKAKPPSEAPPAAAPVLVIRPASKLDAAGVATLVGDPARRSEVEAFIVAALKSKEPVLIAEHGDIVGLVAWHVMPTLQHGPVGRISLLLVAEAERRRGVGRGLLDAAVSAMRHGGCRLVEAMSDIDIRNAHGFFRKLDFRQSSYRFIREI